MGLDIDRDYCRRMSHAFASVLQSAKQLRSHRYGRQHRTERTLNVFYELLQKHQNVGIVIQAYLHRSEQMFAG
jgi:proline dehydrogenase